MLVLAHVEINGTHAKLPALPLQDRNDEKEHACHDGSFTAERLECAFLGRPDDLEVGNAEPSEGTEEIDKSGNLAL